MKKHQTASTSVGTSRLNRTEFLWLLRKTEYQRLVIALLSVLVLNVLQPGSRPWPQALTIGADVNLGPLVGLSTADPRVAYLSGDVVVITDWANAMVAVGALVQDLRTFVGTADPTTLVQNNAFKHKRNALQQKLAGVVQASKTQFHEPWGMVSLFWAAGSPQTSYAKTVTQHLTIERRAQPVIAIAKP